MSDSPIPEGTDSAEVARLALAFAIAQTAFATLTPDAKDKSRGEAYIERMTDLFLKAYRGLSGSS